MGVRCGLGRLGVVAACLGVFAVGGPGCDGDDPQRRDLVGTVRPKPSDAPPIVVTSDLQGVWAVGPANVWAVGTEGTILRYDGTWHRETSPTTQSLTSVWATADGRAWAVGAAGTIVRRDCGVWSVVASPVTDDLWGVWGAAIDDAWAVGDSGAFLHFDGNTWTPAPQQAVATHFRAVWGTAANDVWVAGSGHEPDGDYAAITMHWDGGTWTESFTCNPEGSRYASSGWVAHVDDIFGSNTTNVWGGGRCGPGASAITYIHVIRRDGATWTENPGVPDDNDGRALLQYRSVSTIFTSGPGDVWIAQSATEPQGYADAPQPTMLHFDGYAWTISDDLTTVGIWDLGGTAANDIWAVGVGGKRLHYDGTRWTPSP